MKRFSSFVKEKTIDEGILGAIAGGAVGSAIVPVVGTVAGAYLGHKIQQKVGWALKSVDSKHKTLVKLVGKVKNKELLKKNIEFFEHKFLKSENNKASLDSGMKNYVELLLKQDKFLTKNKKDCLESDLNFYVNALPEYFDKGEADEKLSKIENSILARNRMLKVQKEQSMLVKDIEQAIYDNSNHNLLMPKTNTDLADYFEAFSKALSDARPGMKKWMYDSIKAEASTAKEIEKVLKSLHGLALDGKSITNTGHKQAKDAKASAKAAADFDWSNWMGKPEKKKRTVKGSTTVYTSKTGGVRTTHSQGPNGNKTTNSTSQKLGNTRVTYSTNSKTGKTSTTVRTKVGKGTYRITRS